MDLLNNAAYRIALLARERSREIEQARRLPADLARQMADAGLFRAVLPKSLGGHEAEPAQLLELIETVASGDGSTGWCLMIGATTAACAARLPEDAARLIFGDPLTISAGVFAPMGRAVPDAEGRGWRVTGRWAWGSGAQNADWIFGGCLLLENGEPRRLPNGQPESVMLAFPKQSVALHDTWHSFGLCGTGSLDFSVDDVLVPASHAVALQSAAPREAGVTYAFPIFGLLALGIAAVSLGLLRGVLDGFTGIAGTKRPAGSARGLSERATVQTAMAEASAAHGAARAYLFEAVAQATLAARHGRLDLPAKAKLRLAATHAAQMAAREIAKLHVLAGGTDVALAQPIQRALRDAQVATQHLMVGPATLELAGRALLGLAVDDSQL